MAEVTINADRVDIEFTTWERMMTRRSHVSVPRAAIERADCVDQPLREARGLRRGIAVSGVSKIGVWRSLGGTRQLVSARRQVPGLKLVVDREATGDTFDEIVLSHHDAEALARALA